MAATLAPVTLRLSGESATPRVNPAIEAVKQMSISDLRSEISARRSSEPEAREQAQRETANVRAANAAARLRNLGR